MSVPKWRRSESRLDAFYEAVKLRHIVTQIVMRSYKLKTNFKSLIPDRLRDEYPDHASIVRERRKLKKLKEKLDAGEIEYNEILQQYKSWRGYMKQFNSYKTLKNMDELFDDLFIRQWRCQENVERKQRNDYEYRVKFGEKQYPARRRHGLELESEWD